MFCREKPDFRPPSCNEFSHVSAESESSSCHREDVELRFPSVARHTYERLKPSDFRELPHPLTPVSRLLPHGNYNTASSLGDNSLTAAIEDERERAKGMQLRRPCPENNCGMFSAMSFPSPKRPRCAGLGPCSIFDFPMYPPAQEPPTTEGDLEDFYDDASGDFDSTYNSIPGGINSRRALARVPSTGQFQQPS